MYLYTIFASYGSESVLVMLFLASFVFRLKTSVFNSPCASPLIAFRVYYGEFPANITTTGYEYK